jgi:hypothetical protein
LEPAQKFKSSEELKVEMGKPKENPPVRDDVPSETEPAPKQEPNPPETPKEASQQLFFPAALARAAASLRLKKNS